MFMSFVEPSPSSVCPDFHQLAKSRTVDSNSALFIQRLEPGYRIALGRNDWIRFYAQNREVRKRSNTIHSKWPDANGGYQPGPATIGCRSTRAADAFQSAGPDTREPGCGGISRALRGLWDQAGGLPPPCPKLDRSGETAEVRVSRSPRGFEAILVDVERTNLRFQGGPRDSQSGSGAEGSEDSSLGFS